MTTSEVKEFLRVMTDNHTFSITREASPGFGHTYNNKVGCAHMHMVVCFILDPK